SLTRTWKWWRSAAWPTRSTPSPERARRALPGVAEAPAPAHVPAAAGTPAPVPVVRGVRIGLRDHVHVAALRPQVHDAGGDAREAVFVPADAARLVAVDAAGERDLAVLLEHRRVVEAGAAGDEAAPGLVAGAARRAVHLQPDRDHLEA